MVLCHISHVYATGCSLYFTVAAAGGRGPARAVAARRRPPPTTRSIASRRDDHPPPRGRHRPQPWLAPEIGAGRRRRAACGEARARPGRDPQPGGPDPVSSLAFTFLVNPNSGGGAAPKAVVPVARRLREAGADVEVTYTSGRRPSCPTWSRPPSPRRRRRRRSAATGCCRRSRARSSTPAASSAVIPAGRGNDFARMLGCPTDEAAQVALLLDGTPTPVDLLSVAMPAGRPRWSPARSTPVSTRAPPRSWTGRTGCRRRCSTRSPSVRALATYRPRRR